MIVGTAGHVDHGKTTLVKALTGTDTDRLPEEHKRGISIALGYAYTPELGIVDVPGHERFVHTMLAGATGIDAALLVVAADDGVMPQTVEHLAILDLLGIDRGVVAITKADAVSEARLAEVAAAIRALLAGSVLAEAVVLPVSALTGAGLAELRAALLALGPRARDTEGYPRLAVDRAFILQGTGLVLAGTLFAGRIEVEDRLLLSPAGIELRVRGIHAQNRASDHAVAGQRVALNVTGTRLAKEDVARGDWVVAPAIHAPATRLDARLRLLPSEARALRADAVVHLHLGAADVLARVAPLDAERIEPGALALARLTLDHPIGTLANDRFVLRDAGASRTIGGGVVIDPFGPARGRRSIARVAQLRALADPDPAGALASLLALPPGWTEAAPFAVARNLRDLAVLPADRLGPLLIAPAAHEGLRGAMLGALAALHRDQPDQPGLQPERLRLRPPGRPPLPAFRALVEAALAARQVEQDGPWLRLPTHRATLAPAEERIWAQASALIAAERFRPPRTRDLARALSVPEPAMRTLLKRCQRMGRLVEVAHDHFFLRETVAEMVAIARDIEDAQGMVVAAAFRDRLDNGRKVAIQILEFLDRQGVTRRHGDERIIRADRQALFGAPPDLPESAA